VSYAAVVAQALKARSCVVTGVGHMVWQQQHLHTRQLSDRYIHSTYPSTAASTATHNSTSPYTPALPAFTASPCVCTLP
jgi:hypothetical protein